ncbi:TonB-dependent receptor domain-containing protein [Sphingomonas glacialis]|uniref:TonB-dependent receptor domain-containing protein n=1 Tax=Sphingomonas glacialis TaxID=658225 RepID=UPI001F4F5B2C|nr:TonB-dependent receptor [Sphingomonas glacialis]
MFRIWPHWLGLTGITMASGGLSRLNNALRIVAPLAIALATLLPESARAQGVQVAIAAEPLDRALTALAQQSGFDIISTEPGLSRVRARAVRGRMAPREALRRLLDGTGYRAIAIDARSYRVVRAPVATIAPRPRPPVHKRADAPGDTADIVVTASKQGSTLLRFPGSALLVGGFAPGSLAARSVTMDDVARDTPVLQNTELGEGRNKIFIRGIADSSFNGPTQSTASLYFDEVPLGFAGPEPSLNLYDMKSVEVLEGPQGTLYGSGAIGGIIHLEPNPTDLAKVHASLSGGVTATQGGEAGFDAAGMINLPILTDRVGLRVVGYRERDGGYLTDSMRGLGNINRTDRLGGRASLLIAPGDGWSIEIGALGQKIDATDAQYAETMSGPLERRSVLAQPYSSHIKLARGVVRKHWDSGLDLVSATGYVDLRTFDTFDASRAIGATGPTVYTTEQSDKLFVQETRLSRAVPDKIGWLVGIAFLEDRDVQARTFGVPDQPRDIIGVSNRTDSLSVFGEANWPVTERLTLTGGARVTSARTDGEPSVTPRSNSFVKGRATRRVDPTLAASWLVGPRLALFARLQSGYRTGGLAVASGVGRVQDFGSDSISVIEAGLRKQRTGAIGLELTVAASYARWRDIQADLYTRRGQPYTANIGNADIIGLEATGDWVPVPGLHANFAFLYTHNVVDGPLAQSSTKANRRLPETPAFAGNAGLSYHWMLRDASTLSVGTSGRYVGRSVLGTGDFLDVSQGNYAVLDAQVAWHWRKFDVTLAADNLANATANRFSLGNPLILASRQQTTPLRPRNVRLGVSVAW